MYVYRYSQHTYSLVFSHEHTWSCKRLGEICACVLTHSLDPLSLPFLPPFSSLSPSSSTPPPFPLSFSPLSLSPSCSLDLSHAQNTYSFQQSLQKWCSQGTCTSTSDCRQQMPHSRSDSLPTILICRPSPSSRLCIPRLAGSWTPAFSQTSAGSLIQASSNSSLDQPTRCHVDWVN